MDVTSITLRRRRGAITVVVVVALLVACTPSAETTSTTEASVATEATTSSAPVGGGPNVAPVDVCPMLTLDDIDVILGLLDLPLPERGIFTFDNGETCRWLHDAPGDRFVEITPGSPDDFAEGAELLETVGTPVVGIGEDAMWFGRENVGVLSVVERTDLGFLFVRFHLQRPDLDDAGRQEVLTDLASQVLPAFPGMEPRVVTFEPEPLDLSNVSFVDNLLVKEAAGEWTRGEGLVQTLRLFLDEADPTEVLRHSDLQSTEATGIFIMAEEYLETGEDPEARTEIARLLDILVFTNEELETLAGIGQPTASAIDLAAPAMDCSLFFYGYSTLPTGVGPCLEFQSLTFDGKLYRVFYPANSLPNAGWKSIHYRWALEAMADTLLVYTAHGTMPAVNLVFSIFPGDALAVTLKHTGEPCPIALYTRMQGLGVGDFKQTVAHELAHCFSGENYAPQNAPGYRFVKWREEGVADFMSNLVYPDNNFEWDPYPNLAGVELDTTLFDRAYSNSILFQFLAGKLGDTRVLGGANPPATGLIHTLPTSGETLEQQNALAAYQNMPNLYHEFAQKMTDASVADSSSQLITYDPQANYNPISGQITLDGIPMRFGVSRIHVEVDGGKTACLEYDKTDDIQSSWRPGPPGRQGASASGWSEALPKTLVGDAIFLSTAITPGAEPVLESGQKLTIRVTDVVDDPADCEEDSTGDDCLILLCGPSNYFRLCFRDVCLTIPTPP